MKGFGFRHKGRKGLGGRTAKKPSNTVKGQKTFNTGGQRGTFGFR